MKVFAALAMITLASTVSAQPAGGTDIFTELDVDQNQNISIEEAKVYEPALTQFEGLDVNKDGQLSRDEFSSLIKS